MQQETRAHSVPNHLSAQGDQATREMPTTSQGGVYTADHKSNPLPSCQVTVERWSEFAPTMQKESILDKAHDSYRPQLKHPFLKNPAILHYDQAISSLPKHLPSNVLPEDEES